MALGFELAGFGFWVPLITGTDRVPLITAYSVADGREPLTHYSAGFLGFTHDSPDTDPFTDSAGSETTAH